MRSFFAATSRDRAHPHRPPPRRTPRDRAASITSRATPRAPELRLHSPPREPRAERSCARMNCARKLRVIEKPMRDESLDHRVRVLRRLSLSHERALELARRHAVAPPSMLSARSKVCSAAALDRRREPRATRVRDADAKPESLDRIERQCGDLAPVDRDLEATGVGARWRQCRSRARTRRLASATAIRSPSVSDGSTRTLSRAVLRWNARSADDP